MRFQRFELRFQCKPATVELGGGKHVPDVRRHADQLALHSDESFAALRCPPPPLGRAHVHPQLPTMYRQERTGRRETAPEPWSAHLS
jgi:hypothetical protein